MEFAYACGARMYMGKVNGNLHVLLIVLYTKIYGFHVPYHEWCMKVHRKVHGNLHVLLIVLYTKVYGFHVPYHVWCIKVHT